MYALSSLRLRVSRVAAVFLLAAVVVLVMATMAAANSPDALPVEVDGGIGGEVVLPVEPDGGIGN